MLLLRKYRVAEKIKAMREDADSRLRSEEKANLGVPTNRCM